MLSPDPTWASASQCRQAKLQPCTGEMQNGPRLIDPCWNAELDRSLPSNGSHFFSQVFYAAPLITTTAQTSHIGLTVKIFSGNQIQMRQWKIPHLLYIDDPTKYVGFSHFLPYVPSPMIFFPWPMDFPIETSIGCRDRDPDLRCHALPLCQAQGWPQSSLQVLAWHFSWHGEI